MEHSRMNYTDRLKVRIYEDYLHSVALVRSGMSSDAAFSGHEERVYRLRTLVAAAEARPTALRLVG